MLDAGCGGGPAGVLTKKPLPFCRHAESRDCPSNSAQNPITLSCLGHRDTHAGGGGVGVYRRGGCLGHRDTHAGGGEGAGGGVWERGTTRSSAG
jgi:hypothetical protein